MLTLLKTLFEITILRKGPDALPAAWLVFYVTVLLWFSGIVLMAAVIPGLKASDLTPDIIGWAVTVIAFAIIIAVAGYPERLPQALSAIVGCGVIVLYMQVLAVAVLSFADSGAASIAIQFLSLWAVFVKGHIIAATINIKPLLGVGISLIVFIMRMLVAYSLSPV